MARLTAEVHAGRSQRLRQELKTLAEAEFRLKAKAEPDLRAVVDIEYAEGCATATLGPEMYSLRLNQRLS